MAWLCWARQRSDTDVFHYYFNAYGSNFGDALGAEIVQRLSNGNSKSLNLCGVPRCFARHRPAGLFGLGSIFHRVESGDVVWGTGISPRWQARSTKDLANVGLVAVRGPLTQRYITEQLGLDCPATFGDPALLIRRLFSLPQPRPVRRYGIIPHHWDEDVVADHANVCVPSRTWRQVVDFILGCELVISSSLHGIIVAEALGVSARWWSSDRLPSRRTEGTFKYNDYYASTDRSLNDWAETIEAAVRLGGKDPIAAFDTSGLLASFPGA